MCDIRVHISPRDKPQCLDLETSRPLCRFLNYYVHCEDVCYGCSGGTPGWDFGCWDYECECPEKRRIVYTQICISVSGNPVTTVPSDSVYLVHVAQNTVNESDFQEALYHDDEAEVTTFSICDTMDDSEAVQRDFIKKYFGGNILSHSHEFVNFDGKKSQDSYIKFFRLLIEKFSKPAEVPQQKENPHMGKKGKRK